MTSFSKIQFCKMLKSTSIYLLVGFVHFVTGRDYVIESYNRAKIYDSDPCDDFYRHYCPLGKETAYDELHEDIYNLKMKTMEMSFFKTEIKNDIKTLIEKQGKVYGDEYYFREQIRGDLVEYFETLCLSNHNSSIFLSTLKEITKKEMFASNLEDLSEDKNCSKTKILLEGTLEYYEPKHNIFTLEVLYSEQERNLTTTLMYADEKIIRAMVEIESYLDEMRFIVERWAKETPWLINSGTEDIFPRIINNFHLDFDVSKRFMDELQMFLAVEKAYISCKNGIGMSNGAEIVICANYALKISESRVSVIPPMQLLLLANAFNFHPVGTLYYPFIYLFSQLNDEASKIGIVGNVLAHEFGHSIIENYDDFIYVPYFSEHVRTCIQKQFNSTCKEFSEMGRCAAYSRGVDENGADLIGHQLTYEMLKNYYNESLREYHSEIDATYEQLYFYASNLFFCNKYKNHYNINDTHSPSNIRSNVFVQLPEFQTAFNCSNDSRMMHTLTDRCIILGEGAPEKRHR